MTFTNFLATIDEAIRLRDVHVLEELSIEIDELLLSPEEKEAWQNHIEAVRSLVCHN